MTTEGTPYQSLERLKMRLEYDAEDLFDSRDNADKRFDRLLMGTAEVGDGDDFDGLEAEARKTIESYHSNEPFTREVDRVDELRATDDAAIPLVGPIESVSSVEIKQSLRGDYRELDTGRWDFTDYRLILGYGPNRAGIGRQGRRRNVIADSAARAEWSQIAQKIRVTYTRGFDPIPADVRSIQVRLINRMLRNLKTEQNISAMEPDQIQAVTSAEAVVTEDIENRIRQITPLRSVVRSV